VEATIEESYLHTGPIPDPRTLIHYNSAVPDAAERILSMAENEAMHRQQLEASTLEANIKDRKSLRLEMKIGQLLAFMLCVFVIFSGAYIAIEKAAWPGVLLGSTGLSGIILAYLKNKN